MLTGGGVGLARCWVLREQPVSGVLLRGWSWPVVSLLAARVGVAFGSGRSSNRSWCSGVGGGCRLGTGGCLRTAQWTRASLNDLCGQVFKCTGWMPWHQEPKKDVVACDKPRGVGKRTVIRGSPNGETPHESCRVTLT